jgi:hypothetical protein
MTKADLRKLGLKSHLNELNSIWALPTKVDQVELKIN